MSTSTTPSTPTPRSGIREAAKPAKTGQAASGAGSTRTAKTGGSKAAKTKSGRGGDAGSAVGKSGTSNRGTRTGTSSARVRTGSAASIAEAERSGQKVTASATAMRAGRSKLTTSRGREQGGQGVAEMLRERAASKTWIFRRNRVGGVAPFVPPKGRLGRRLRMREWSRVGFVQLSPGKQKLRHRILPRTVIGIVGLLMAAGVGAGFSGAAFYAYYSNRLAENERTVARFIEGFDQQFTDAAGALDEMRTEAVGTIRTELEPLSSYVADANGIVGLPATAGPSVWLVETRDQSGQVTHGSAFAVVANNGETVLVTSHAVVQASTVQPGPAIELLKGGQRLPATLWAWDVETDLALVVVDQDIPTLTLANESTQVRAVGGPVFAMSGFGGQGATASPGHLLDHSKIGLQHTAPVGSLYVGGPLVDAEGRVLGMASANYEPMGIDPGEVAQAPDIAAICRTVLRCSEDDLTLTVEVADD